MLPDIHHVRQTSINIGGVVQGIGRRPFLYTLARKYNLTAFYLNDSHGILIKVQGIVVDKFFLEIHHFPLPCYGLRTFRHKPLPTQLSIRILPSDTGNVALVFHDSSACGDCRKGLFALFARHYRHWPLL
ncbi:MAG: acylphosphatase [Candidatus Brocadia sp.]|nr:MAG: acylphosphatase [Candidatus Brocadia sp.]